MTPGIEGLRALADRLASEPEVFELHFELGAPAKRRAIDASQAALGATLPPDLVGLYLSCGQLSLAWSVREGQAYRVRADEDDRPSGQLDLRGPKDLRRWGETAYAVVFGDGTGDGIALEIAAKGKPFVAFDHDAGRASGARYGSVEEVLAELVSTACMGDAAEDLMTPTLRKFLSGKGKLAPARAPVQVKAPKPVAERPSAAAPAVLELAPHKAAVTAIAAIDARRVATASYHEKNIVVRDVARRAPLGKLVGRGTFGILFTDGSGRLLATSRNGLDRWDLASGAREPLTRMNPHYACVELEPDGSLLALTTAFLERVKLVEGPPTKYLVEISGSHYVRPSAGVALVLGMTSRAKLTLARVELRGDRGSVVLQREWPVATSFAPAATMIGGRLAIALANGTLAFADPTTLEPVGPAPKASVTGPGVLADAGRAWIVARPDRVDVYATGDGALRRSAPLEKLRAAISAMTVAGDRLVVGDAAGSLVSIDLATLL